MVAGPAAREWLTGWRVVAAGIIGMMVVNLHSATLGVLMTPLNEAFGWSRAQVSASILIITILLLLLGPLAGILVDRYGPRRIASAGIALFSLGLAGVGLSGPEVWTWYLAWAFVGVVYAAASSVVWTTAISRSFVKHRGLALSIALSGTGLANFITPLLAVWTFQNFGWRGTFFTLAAGGLLVALPLIWMLLATSGRGSSGRPAGAIPLEGETQRPGLTIREVLRSTRFWRLVATMLLTAAGVSTLFYHFQPMLRDAGVSAVTAASYAAVTGPTLIIGRILGGYLLDRMSARLVAAVSFALPAAACLILMQYDGSMTMGLLAAVIIGLSFGAEGDVVAYLTAQYFGLRHYAFTYAIVYGVYAFAFGLSPVIAGAVFDVFGSYNSMLALLIVGLLLSAVIVALLGKPPDFSEAEA